MWHLVNGDTVASKLQGLPGHVLVWREMYDAGPLAGDASSHRLRRRRAAFFARHMGIPPGQYLATCQQQEAALAQIPPDDEVVLWFEHDRYDQTMLLYLLHRLAGGPWRRLSLVSIDRYPGVEPFFGLGQLPASALQQLWARRQPVTAAQLAEAQEGWAAYTHPDPTVLAGWVQTRACWQLPYLAAALRRHLAHFPALQHGLGVVEEAALTALAAGRRRFSGLFQAVAHPLDGLSDLYLSALLRQFSQGPTPLLVADGPWPCYQAPQRDPLLALTDEGRAVLRGERDRAEWVTLDWWLGGVHLAEDAWRRDGERLVPGPRRRRPRPS